MLSFDEFFVDHPEFFVEDTESADLDSEEEQPEEAVPSSSPDNQPLGPNEIEIDVQAHPSDAAAEHGASMVDSAHGCNLCEERIAALERM